MVLGTVKLRHRKSTMWPTTRGRESQKKLRKNSRSFSSRPSKSWIATQNWLDWAEMHRNGWIGTRRPLLPSIQRWISEISKTLVSHIKQIGQECSDATSIRLPKPQSQSWTVPTENQEKNVQNLVLFNNIKNGTLFSQVIHGGIGTRPKAGGAHEFNFFFQLFVALGFAYSWWRSAVTYGWEV